MKALRLAFLGVALLAFHVQAQTYPNKPIRLVVGFAPGGNTDTVARVVGQKLGERLGQQVVIDNRAGAGGTIGTADVARAAPDGYTLTMGTTTTHAIAVSAYKGLTYDPVADFDPIALVANAPYLLVVHSSMPARNLAELVALVKSQPGKLNYGSAGQATTTHLVMATFAQRAGLDMVHVPFKGGAPATTAVLANQVEILFGACRRCCRTSPPAGCARSRSARRSARLRCPTSPRSPNPAIPASTSRCGSASSRRTARPRPSSSASSRNWCRSPSRRR